MEGDGKLVLTRSNFFVEMDASSMHTMNIPKKYAKMWEGDMRENVELEGPSRITWQVKMIKLSNNTFAMQSGWKEFVIANQIDKNDVLVFTYNGNSSFKVMIFDRSGCEKAAPFFVRKTETKSEELNDSLIRQIAIPHSEVKKELSLFSGNSDTDESSRDISSHSIRVRRTGERDCGKWKQRDFVQESSESESESDSRTVRKRKIKENKAKKASRPSHTHIRRGPPPTAKVSRGTTGNPSNGPSDPEQSPGGPTSASTSTGTRQDAAKANATNMPPVKSNKRERKFVIQQEEGSDNSTDSSDGEYEIVWEPVLTKKYKEEKKEERENAYEYQLPEFYNFGNDRSIEKFKPGQTWALYSSIDILPKYYVSVKQVDLEKKTVHVMWLKPYSDGVAGEERRWIDLNLPLGCGTFTFGNTAWYNDTEVFSHEMETVPVPGKKNVFEIVPVKTETWAVYRNWKIGWSRNDITRNCQYNLIRVSNVTRTWIEVLYLAKVAGHSTVFKLDHEKKPMKIAKGEFLKFSHKILAHRLSDEAGHDLSGCWELDPGALPYSHLD